MYGSLWQGWWRWGGRQLAAHLGVEKGLGEKHIRTVRWLCAPLALIPSLLYRPPPGSTMPLDPMLVGAAVASALVLVNLISIASGNVDDPGKVSRVGRIELAADTLIALVVVGLYGSDPTAAAWSILFLPIVEGAMRAGLGGAVTTWAVCASGYIAWEFVAPRIYALSHPGFGRISYRVELMLVIALATGALARNLQSRIADHQAARRESERRAELLHIVARTSRSMSTPDTDQVISAVVDAAVEIGFETTAVVMLNEDDGTLTIRASRGFDIELTKRPRKSSEGLIGRVRTERQTVVVDDYSAWHDGVPAASGLALRAAVATPIWRNDALHAVLTMASRRHTSVSQHEIEALELLASHAGAALTTASHLSQRQALKAQLDHETLHDALTGLPNRTLFRDRLNHCLERKATAPTPTAVAFVDLDGFKHVNDSHGQSVGDDVLRVVADRLRSIPARGDTVARYVGDQFALLFERPESQGEVVNVATRIIDELQKPIPIAGSEVYLSASVGVSFRYEMERLARDFLREADLAMRRAKERGGGRVESYASTMAVHVEHRFEMEQQLRRALKNDELAVYYQPGINLETGELVGLEALVRWKHPTRGVVAADDFIPAAQETGLIVAVGQRLLEEVGAQISVWRATGAVPPVPVGVNLSAPELLHDDFVRRVISVLDAHRVHPNDIIFEMTESIVMSDDEKTRSQIEALRRIGVRLAIDDFGLGYSSLSYLKRFPFSVLKIDRSFVSDLANSEADQAIVRYILGLARDLRMPVIAEGVEAKEHLDHLRSMGCQFAQGFYICEPVTALRLRQLLAKRLIGVGEWESTTRISTDEPRRGSVAATA